MSFKFPWRFHSVTKGQGSFMLVQVENQPLLAVYERALAHAEREFEDMPAPKTSTDESHYRWRSLQHEVQLLQEAVEWLRELKP